MTGIQARVVAPRSTTWELDDPVFRVTFFRHDPAFADAAPGSVGHESQEWELTGGDVREALDWAARNAGPDRTWMLHVAGPPGERPGLIRLAGTDPNAARVPSPESEFSSPEASTPPEPLEPPD